jgi:hypothetical protein
LYSLLIRAVLNKINVDEFKYEGLNGKIVNMSEIDSINLQIVAAIEQNIRQPSNSNNNLVNLLARRRELIKPIQKNLKKTYKDYSYIISARAPFRPSHPWIRKNT